MKGLFRKLSNTNISITYMFIVLGVSTLMVVGYFSYAWFTVQGVQKYSVITGNLTGTLAIGSNTATINGSGVLEYTPSTNNDTLTITVTNTSDRTAKNSLYYYTLSDSSITIGYASDSSIIPSVTGVSVDKGNSLTYKIKIKGASGKTIKIGSSMGLSNSNLSLPNGTSAFDVFKMTGKVAAVLLAGVGDNGAIDTSDSEQTFITGTDPNNYIWYSGKLWRAVSIDPSDNSVKLVTQWNISSLSYNANNNTNFKDSYMEQWLNDTSVDGFLGNLREPEKFIKTDSTWNATLATTATKPEKTTMVTDAVGLLNLYEYDMSYKNATALSFGYLNNGLDWFTLTPSDTSKLNYVTNIGTISDYISTAAEGHRPAINLKPTVKIIDGDGTNNNPFRLDGDNDKPILGTKLTTRYSGEYVSFGTGENNLYRIVSHENETGTKITSAIPLKDNGGYKKIAFGSTAFFSNNNTIGTFLNGDYLTSGTYLTSDQANMIDDNSIWYLGAVGDVNYKMAKYQNTTSNNLTTSTTTAKVGLLRLGELMSGQFDNNSNNESYFTLSPHNTTDFMTSVRAVYDTGNALDGFVSSVTMGVKPAMNLKSNVVITGGTGTKSDPFTIKLG